MPISIRRLGGRRKNCEGIFDRFTQLNRESRGGLGLGLYISPWIVEQHGGTIRVESKVGAERAVCPIPAGSPHLLIATSEFTN